MGALYSIQRSAGLNKVYLNLARDPNKNSVVLTERRKLKRKPIASPTDIFCDDNRHRYGKGLTIDMSERGMKLITSECFELGKELSFHFSLSNGLKFDFFGRIVHAEEAVESIAYGIEFSPSQGTFLLRLWLGPPDFSRRHPAPEAREGGDSVHFGTV